MKKNVSLVKNIMMDATTAIAQEMLKELTLSVQKISAMGKSKHLLQVIGNINKMINYRKFEK